jgi:hypothetical protein
MLVQKDTATNHSTNRCGAKSLLTRRGWYHNDQRLVIFVAYAELVEFPARPDAIVFWVTGFSLVTVDF